jgi:predicted DsbA family dithiol-disulfide isomerase
VLEHRAFPLRPAPDPTAAFKGTYREQAWLRCGEMAKPDGIAFNPWPHVDHYPNWSLPGLEAAKCAALQGTGAFDRLHLRLYRAFITESRNIADPGEVVKIAAEEGLDADRFLADYRAGTGRDGVVKDYTEAVEEGVRSIPTVVFPETGQALVGLVDLAQYRTAIAEATR